MTETRVGVPLSAVLVVCPACESDETIRSAFRAEGVAATGRNLSYETAWPEESFSAAIVSAPALTDDVRATAQRLKSARPRVPLILWAPLSAAEIGEALAAGFDLWLPAGTPTATVAAQIRAVERLTGTGPIPAPNVVTIRGLTVDFQRHEVLTGNEPLPLTPTEYRIVSYLARNPGRVIAHPELFREVHGYEASEQEAKDILKVHISRLRNKLAAAGIAEDVIVTVRGFGYLLERRTRHAEADTEPEEE